MANRFYEALNYSVLTLFDIECQNTISMSGYDIPPYCMVSNEQELTLKTQFQMPEIRDYCLRVWKEKAEEEVKETLTKILLIVE